MNWIGPKLPMCNHFACRFEWAEEAMDDGKFLMAMDMYLDLVPCRVKTSRLFNQGDDR